MLYTVDFTHIWGNFMRSKREKYEEYINSRKWIEFASKLKRERKRCQICGSNTILHAHHLTYRNFTKETGEDIAILCQNCHFVAHRLMEDSYLKGKIKGRKIRNQLKMLKKLVKHWYTEQERVNKELYS